VLEQVVYIDVDFDLIDRVVPDEESHELVTYIKQLEQQWSSMLKVVFEEIQNGYMNILRLEELLVHFFVFFQLIDYIPSCIRFRVQTFIINLSDFAITYQVTSLQGLAKKTYILDETSLVRVITLFPDSLCPLLV